MTTSARPLVSVVTPFFNTAPYLGECIESVRAQRYDAWEYLLVDNCSTDGSGDIARAFAARDGRIRVIGNDRFLGQVDNYNHALGQISGSSAYCKVVQADDWLYEDCLARMVELAEQSPTCGYVTSFFMHGDSVRGGPVPPGTSVLDGREVVRTYFERGIAVFGSPTTVMYRADLVRARPEFFSGHVLHEDTDALFRILERWDVGFVHAVLSFCRTDNESITSAVRAHDPYVLDRFLRTRLYADRFLEASEARSVKERAEKEYLQYLAGKMLGGAGFRAYHRKGWDTVGYRPPAGKLLKAMAWEALDVVGNPKRSAGRLVAWMRGSGGREEVE